MSQQPLPEEQPRLQLNGPVPDFDAKTTHGPIRLSEWNKEKWDSSGSDAFIL